MTPQFVDLSVFQPATIDWHAYKAWSAQGDGISRVAMRSSYGAGYKDQHFDAYRAGALAAGIDVILFYHYAYPSLNAAMNEANYQKSVVGDIRTQDILILDFEENVPQATSTWAYQWLSQQTINYGGKLPGIYASSSYIQQRLNDPRLAKFPLWLANWQFSPDARPPVPAPWTSYEFVQYTDKATNIPGISGTVDANVYLGKETPPIMQSTTIDLTNGTVASHFSGDDNIWTCKDNGFVIGHGILNFYRAFGGDALCGLTYLGLPRSNELPVKGYPEAVQQEFERACVVYDPKKELDNPPGSGPVYVTHVERDPRTVDLLAKIADLQQQLNKDSQAQQIKALQSQIATLQSQNDQLKTLLDASNLGKINGLAQQIVDLSHVQ